MALSKKTCPECNEEFRVGSAFNHHVRVCEKNPGAAVLRAMWDFGDSILSMSQTVGVDSRIIRRWLSRYDIHQPRETAIQFFQADKPKNSLRYDLATGVECRKTGDCKKSDILPLCRSMVNRFDLMPCEIPDDAQIKSLERQGLDVVSLLWELQWRRVGG